MVKKVNQVEKIHASAVEKDVVDTADGVAAVYQDKLPDIRSKNRFQKGFSKSAQVWMGNLVGLVKSLRHVIKNLALGAEGI